MFRKLILVLIILSCNHAEKNTLTHYPSADSLIQVMRTSLADDFHHRRLENIIQYLDSIRNTVYTQKDPALISAWLAYRGAAFVFSDNADSARFYMTSALNVAGKDSTRKALIIPKIQFVTFLVQQKAYDSALQHGLEAYELSKLSAPPELPILYSQLSFLYKVAGDSANRRKFLFEGLQIAKEPQHIAILSSEIGRFYSEYNHVDSAIYFYEHFLSFNKYSNSFIEAWKHDDLGSLLLTQNRIKQAIDNMLKAVTLYRENGKSNERLYYNIGTSYHRINMPENGDRYLDTASTLARSHENFGLISTIFSEKAKFEQGRSRYELAYRYLDSSHYYHQQNDSLSFLERARMIEAKIGRKAKDDQIVAMKSEVKASKKIMRQRQVIIIVLILAALLLIAFGVLLFRRRQMQLQLRESELEQQALVRQMQLQLRESELEQEALVKQMQPHFVFNALGVLQSFIRNDHPQKAINYLTHFSKLIRMNLENSRQTFVPLHDELIVLKSYLDLQQMNHENLFEYEIDVYDPEDDIFIPSMLLQPFVENSILHGFTNLSYMGQIKITIEKDKDGLQCKVEDNGIGINSETNQIKRSYSTTITKERLDLLSQQTGRIAKVTIYDKQTAGEGPGVRVILDFPFRLAHNAKDN